MHKLDKWIEIDVDAVRNNLEQVRSILDQKAILIAVLKAEAYGHGARDIARLLNQQGVDFFAVTFLYEALQLRKAGISSNILVFSPLVDEEQAAEAIENSITITIASREEAAHLIKVTQEMRKTATIHLKLDTGLGRFGLSSQELIELAQELNSCSNIYLEGIYTHMADAAGQTAYTARQFELFLETVRYLEQAGIRIPLQHCANSAVFLKYPQMHLDAVRIGTLLSGQHPVGNFERRLSLKDPYRFKSRIVSLRRLEKGSYLGYFRTYRLKKQALIGVVPVGFNDGLALEVANPPAGFVDLLKGMARQILVYFNRPRFRLNIIIKGMEYPIRGKVFMQMALVEFPPEADIRVGDEVELPVRKTLAAKNIVRLYVKDGVAGKVASEDATTFI
ncbi:MAG: alanine racemase [Syntrophomonadaceae bacterium]